MGSMYTAIFLIYDPSCRLLPCGSYDYVWLAAGPSVARVREWKVLMGSPSERSGQAVY